MHWKEVVYHFFKSLVLLHGVVIGYFISVQAFVYSGFAHSTVNTGDLGYVTSKKDLTWRYLTKKCDELDGRMETAMIPAKHRQEEGCGSRWRTGLVLWCCGGHYSSRPDMKLHISEK